LHGKVSSFERIIEIFEFFDSAIRDFSDKDNENHEQKSNTDVSARCNEKKLLSGHIWILTFYFFSEWVSEMQLYALHSNYNFGMPIKGFNVVDEIIQISDFFVTKRSHHRFQIQIESCLWFVNNPFELFVDSFIFRSLRI